MHKYSADVASVSTSGGVVPCNLKREHSLIAAKTGIAAAPASHPEEGKQEDTQPQPPTNKRIATEARNVSFGTSAIALPNNNNKLGKKKSEYVNEENTNKLNGKNSNVAVAKAVAGGSHWLPAEVDFSIGEYDSLNYGQRVQKLCAHLNKTDLSKMYGDVPDDPDMLSPEYIHYRSLTQQEREVRKQISKTKRSQRKQVREKHRRELGNHYLEHLRMLLGLNMGTSVVEIVHAACDMMERYSRQAVVAEELKESGDPTPHP